MSQQQKRETHVGLSPEEVVASRTAHGVNRLTPPRKESLWLAFLRKFNDPLIIVLLVVMCLSAGISCFEYFRLGAPKSVFLEPLGVLVALLLATGVGFIFEVRAERAFDVLNTVSDDTPVKVLRRDDGGASRMHQVPRHEVVVGDLVSLEAGEEVPADGDLLQSVSLGVDESTLTGEPLAHKAPADGAVQEAKAPTKGMAEQATYPAHRLMKGSVVVEGHGLMRVTEVGDTTEYGHVYHAVQIDNKVKTPLSRQLDRLGRDLSKFSFVVGGAIFLGRLLYLFFSGDPEHNTWIEILQYILQAIMIAVTLIVVSVPEGLPLSITLSLALSMKKMLKQNNLVRKLHACETMGAATVICTDKTGTLTLNQMQVHRLQNLLTPEVGDKRADAILAEAIAVNSTAWIGVDDEGHRRVLGNPTEGALLLWLDDQGVDYLTLRDEATVVEQQPFSPETKQMSTTVESPLWGQRVRYVKGAPELLLAQSVDVVGGTTRAEVEAWVARCQEQAMRTLGFAYATEAKPDELHFFAMAAIMDPIRQEVPEAIATCRQAGIDVIIVTGDTAGTAGEIGRQIGLLSPENGHEVLTGTEFAALTDAEALSLLPEVGETSEAKGRLKILARARPLDKQRLVQLLQRKHHVVAVTGDGTNDAPALKAAQVGLSMGDGTAVAKEASDITIIDNSFRSITNAVLWGRSLYINIGRFLLFQMTVNASACLIVLVGAFVGKESPLSVTQMLWVNLIMDTFAAMALSALPPDSRVMHDAPRSPRAHIIDRRMSRHIIGWGLALTAVLLLCWALLPHRYFFTIFVLLQFWNLFNARYFRTDRSLLGEVFSGRPEQRARWRQQWSWSFIGIACAILFGQMLIVQFGGEMFNITARLTWTEWLTLIAATFSVFLVGDFIRLRPWKAV
jgi:Ca2+-transporting ATPase